MHYFFKTFGHLRALKSLSLLFNGTGISDYDTRLNRNVFENMEKLRLKEFEFRICSNKVGDLCMNNLLTVIASFSDLTSLSLYISYIGFIV